MFLFSHATDVACHAICATLTHFTYLYVSKQPIFTWHGTNHGPEVAASWRRRYYLVEISLINKQSCQFFSYFLRQPLVPCQCWKCSDLFCLYNTVSIERSKKTERKRGKKEKKENKKKNRGVLLGWISFLFLFFFLCLSVHGCVQLVFLDCNTT